jgi:hypothetical protein
MVALKVMKNQHPAVNMIKLWLLLQFRLVNKQLKLL